MRRALSRLLIIATLTAAPGAASAQPTQDALSIARVRSQLTALAHDSMLGRRTGTVGAQRAARYIAGIMRDIGLTTGGDNGYLQRIPMRLSVTAQGTVRATALRSFAAYDSLAAAERVLDANVVGIIPGADPVLRNEAIIVGAHYDHIGIRPAVDGDSIANGADDDASGVIAVLEIARALRQGPAPKRTVIFVAFAGEESGGVGSGWYMAQPPVPLERTVAQFQIEMIARPDSLVGGSGRAWLTGYELSTMGPMLAAAGVPVFRDPRPDQNFFRRSDNYRFAQRGIPAHTFSSFNLHTDYHRVSDEVDRVDFAHMTSLIEAATRAVRVLADGPKPEWNPGMRPGGPPPLAPIDAQVVQDQDNMTWSDYRPIPGVNWADPTLTPTRRNFRIALVAVDFPDQPFVITLPKQSDPFGNPQIEPVARARVPRFYADFWNSPSALNHGQTINGYWMEQSRGQVGIGTVDAYGPYRMPRNLFEYGLNEWGQNEFVPTGFVANARIEPHADSLWRAATGDTAIHRRYDIILRIYAGYDETSVWQEFGEMKFNSREDIPAEWGNPDPTKPRWAATRYVPWTSWRAAAQQWGLSSVRQGESSGTITHEIVHFAFRVGDNNNNPYITPYRRAGSGPWDIMDRGSFNGPGGPHRRWVVPAAEGAAMPAGLMLRSKLRFGFVADSSVLVLSRDGLAASGPAVATVTARAVEPAAGQLAGVVVRLDGAEPHDRTPADDMNSNPLSAGRPTYDFYSLEVVQRIGYDSFTPDNGVLIAKNKDEEERNNSCGQSYNCFTWVIDAHPEDIGRVDYVKPNGERVMRTIADYRQLNDALFHAGLNSGSEYEWQDPHNRLHFYIIDVHHDARGVRSYTVGIRSLDGAGAQPRGVAIDAPRAVTREGDYRVCSFTVRNTGTPAGAAAGGHPRAAATHFGQDIVRLSVSGAGAQLRNALAAIPAGAARAVPVHVSGSGQVTLTAVSESDASQRASAICDAR